MKLFEYAAVIIGLVLVVATLAFYLRDPRDPRDPSVVNVRWGIQQSEATGYCYDAVSSSTYGPRTVVSLGAQVPCK